MEKLWEELFYHLMKCLLNCQKAGQWLKTKYKLSNGQGFINKENYLSESGRVISLFEIHRDPDEFFESYQKLLDDYAHVTDSFTLEKQFTLRFNDFEFPAYIIKGVNDQIIRNFASVC